MKTLFLLRAGPHLVCCLECCVALIVSSRYYPCRDTSSAAEQARHQARRIPRATGDAPHFGNAMLIKPRPLSDSLSTDTVPRSLHVDLERFRAELREAGVEEM